jgi:hypothetical protein
MAKHCLEVRIVAQLVHEWVDLNLGFREFGIWI